MSVKGRDGSDPVVAQAIPPPAQQLTRQPATMDDTRFTSMDDSDLLPQQPAAPRDAVSTCAMVNSVASWSYALVGNCFSRVRRVQFDEEHQRSLLSCHSTDENYRFPDEAMLELRRRVMKVEAETRRPVYGIDEPIKQGAHRHSRWKTRKLQQAAAAAKAHDKNKETLPELLSETESALDAILRTSNAMTYDSPVKPDDVRRLSVDELLSMRSPSTASTSSTNSTSGESLLLLGEEGEEAFSADAQQLRSWLADIDTARASEYVAYAHNLEKQGFYGLRDLAQLEEGDVEQAMSEMGISKFAHRARMRKAILRLHDDLQTSSAVAY